MQSSCWLKSRICTKHVQLIKLSNQMLCALFWLCLVSRYWHLLSENSLKQTNYIRNKRYCRFSLTFFFHLHYTTPHSSVYYFHCYLIKAQYAIALSSCGASATYLLLPADLQLSWCAEENVPGWCFCCKSECVCARSRLVFILQKALWVLDGCRSASSTCDEHAARTVWGRCTGQVELRVCLSRSAGYSGSLYRLMTSDKYDNRQNKQ